MASVDQSQDSVANVPTTVRSASEEQNCPSPTEKWRHPFLIVVFSILRFSYTVLNQLYVFPTYIVWCLLLWPLKFLAPDWFHSVEQVPFGWLEHFMAQWFWTAGYSSMCCSSYHCRTFTLMACLCTRLHAHTHTHTHTYK